MEERGGGFEYLEDCGLDRESKDNLLRWRVGLGVLGLCGGSAMGRVMCGEGADGLGDVREGKVGWRGLYDRIEGRE